MQNENIRLDNLRVPFELLCPVMLDYPYQLQIYPLQGGFFLNLSYVLA